MKKIDYSKYEGHTEGPWTIEAHGMADALYSRRDDQHHGLNLCVLSDWDRNGPANARLIADAPYLLAACRERDEEIERLRERDGNAKVELCYNDGIDPFARIDLTCVDYGVADNIYVVELPKGFNITRAALADVEGYT